MLYFLKQLIQKGKQSLESQKPLIQKKVESIFELSLFAHSLLPLKKNGDAFSSAFSLLLLRFLNHFAFAFEFAV